VNLVKRAASLRDSVLLLRWRNSDSSLATSQVSSAVGRPVHEEWLRERIARHPREPFWIFSQDNIPIGYVRLDCTEDDLESFTVSVFVDEDFRGNRLGKKLLNIALSEFLSNGLVKEFRAVIKKDNFKSIKLFKAFGFELLSNITHEFSLYSVSVNQVKLDVRIVFRADASNLIGAGHVMRCSAIMEEAISRGIECIFVGSLGGIRWLEEWLANLGVQKYLDSNELKYLPTRDVLVIDSYDITISDPFIQLKNWKSVVVISDDMTPKYMASLVIQLGFKTASSHEGSHKFVSGPQFIPFRKSISKTTKSLQRRVSKIVVFGGGTDTYKFAAAIAKGIADIKEFKKAIFISNENLQISLFDSRFEVREFGSALDNELEDADLVFTTASTSSLEILARELPLGVCFTANNQISFFNTLIDKRMAIGIGYLTLDKKWCLNWEEISLLIKDPNLRESIVAKARGYFDLLGSSRIVNEIMAL
jgi:spore coat polysaccharide biosynthesis predicted glycosyltransferase SpsG/RimJ/RimL family protein N-acetyltransferase